MLESSHKKIKKQKNQFKYKVLMLESSHKN